MASPSDETISTSSPDENKNTHSLYAVSTSKTSSSSSQNYSTMQTSSHKPNTSFTTKDKRMLKKKSHSYQDLRLPSVRHRHRYANVQSKVKGYIDSLPLPRHAGNRTSLLRQKSMPETLQNFLKEEAMSPGAVQRKLNSVQTENASMSKMLHSLQHDLEMVRIEKHLLAKKVEGMRTEKKNSPKVRTTASREIPFKLVTSTGTQTCAIGEANGNCELSTTVSLHSLAVDDGLTDDTEVQKPKKKSSLNNKVKRLFICTG